MHLLLSTSAYPNILTALFETAEVKSQKRLVQVIKTITPTKAGILENPSIVYCFGISV